MRCIICQQEVIRDVTWQTFLKPPERKKICNHCSHLLEPIYSPCCPSCHRPDQELTCKDCLQWFESHPGLLDRNVSVFKYNEFNKELVARWKYRGDYVLVEAFKEEIQKKWLSAGYQGRKVVQVPLSVQRLMERGFNQSDAIIKVLEEEPLAIFDRTHGEKQSKRGKKDRMHALNPFTLQLSISEPVVIIDDIYTTGRTVRHMADLLKKQGCSSVSSFTIFR
ncbi:competence protein ComFC [Halobacillus karajensis]|uniref:ComF family protein n=1 Tax=Halobacillus karajensis TaxID=195088 RepID=UPI0008A7CAC9|nr:phosphoribosyltransferase family protein [Halobacillus karajensis]SEH40109.1 competence protein ComFC [Halobacillus karajensis]